MSSNALNLRSKAMTFTTEFEVEDTMDDEDNSNDSTYRSNSNNNSSNGHSSSSSTSNKRRRRAAHEQQKVQTYVAIVFILVFGLAAGAAFISLSLITARREHQEEFDRQAMTLVNDIETSWQDYETATLWIHEACSSSSQEEEGWKDTMTHSEFRHLYDYIISSSGNDDGLEFQAAQFVPNVTHDMRDELEAEAAAYYGQEYPDLVNYQGFVGLELVSDRSPEFEITERSIQPFYFVVQFVEPVDETNSDAIHLDLYSSPKYKATIDSALSTWMPTLTDRLKLEQEEEKEETDESASYSVLLMHPGVELESAPEIQPRDLSLMVIPIPSLLKRATKKQSSSISVYLYDRTSAKDDFLGGVTVTMNDDDDEEENSLKFLNEIELDDLIAQQDTKKKDVVELYRETIPMASRSWEVVVVPTEDTIETSSINYELLGGILIFIGTFGLSFWMYKNMIKNNEFDKLAAQAEAERNIVRSLFPSNVRDRLIREATAANGSNGMSSRRDSNGGISGAGANNANALSSEKIFGSKPIADFFTEVTIMFADLVGFTAWSSARDPTQVFALLEVIYHSYDQMAKKRGVFKLETVGDCYVAVCGLPDPRDDHAEVMAKFATDCLIKLHELTSSLELTMGPDTADLDIRVGLHSGPVTAGVLRGDKGRFQLFGDTMNTANRIESTGQRSKIHLSLETAELLKAAGKEHWLTVRKDAVFAKGKGLLKTYWLDITSNTTMSAQSGAGTADGNGIVANNSGLGLNIPGINSSKSTADARVNALKEENHNKRMERLITWSVEVFARLLKLVVAKRHAQGRPLNYHQQRDLDYRQVPAAGNLLEEVKDVVPMPEVDEAADFERRVDPDLVELDTEVEKELQEYISVIAELYHRNPFHNFEHAGHVLMSTCKLLTRIVTPREGQRDSDDDDEDTENNFATRLHQDSYGIASDPLTRFACAFSALIHDVDHPGVPNATLVTEQTSMATTYKNKSVAEQNSIDLAWDLLMSERYKNLVKCLCPDENELNRFRQLVVNMVMATDVMDKSIGAHRKARWEKAFSDQSVQEDAKENFNRKATIVIEHLIQASDVSHTMQHWHVYRKWNERLFYEMYKAYKSGRLSFDPSEKWYEGEIGFLDFYVIPMAKKLDTCGVFGVSSDELLNYAEANRKEWESKGRDIVRSYLESYTERYE